MDQLSVDDRRCRPAPRRSWPSLGRAGAAHGCRPVEHQETSMNAIPTISPAVHRAAGRLRRLLSKIGDAVRAAHGASVPFW